MICKRQKNKNLEIVSFSSQEIDLLAKCWFYLDELKKSGSLKPGTRLGLSQFLVEISNGPFQFVK